MPSSYDNGNVSRIEYDRYHFETRGWKMAVLFALLGGSPSTGALTHKGKRRMSAQARAKIAAAMRARWAKRKGRTTATKSAKKKGGLTAAGRKRLSQLMKARWAARRKAAAGKK